MIIDGELIVKQWLLMVNGWLGDGKVMVRWLLMVTWNNKYKSKWVVVSYAQFTWIFIAMNDIMLQWFGLIGKEILVGMYQARGWCKGYDGWLMDNCWWCLTTD